MKLNKMFLILTLAVAILGVGSHAWADGEGESQPAGVLGCNAIELDPAMAFESQEAICDAGEQFAASSCGRSGHGKCSSPKTNDTNPEGTHCVCLSEILEEAPADPVL